MAIAIAAIVGLVVFSGYLLYQNSNLRKISEKQSLQIDESEQLKAELDESEGRAQAVRSRIDSVEKVAEDLFGVSRIDRFAMPPLDIFSLL